MDLDLIKGVGPATKEKLHDAGVTSVEDLAQGDKDALAETTGIPAGRIASFITQAQGILAAESAEDEDADVEATQPASNGPVAVAPGDTAAPATNGTDETAEPPAWRVILHDRAATARVEAGGVTYENLPIVTAKLDEDEGAIMQEIGYNAVLLKEQATTASVRVDGDWRADVPIYKERLLDGMDGVAELTRVRVHEIRERGAASAASTPTPAAGKPKGGFLAKVFGRK